MARYIKDKGGYLAISNDLDRRDVARVQRSKCVHQLDWMCRIGSYLDSTDVTTGYGMTRDKALEAAARKRYA